MLSRDYVMAFNQFLKFVELKRPETPIDAVVQLFLLVCDLAINPSNGYPFDLSHFESFIISADPGYRFFLLSRYIAKNPVLKSMLKRYSRDEYIELSSILCRALSCHSPIEISEHIMDWTTRTESIKNLLTEDDTFRFRDENLPVRLCFAKHIRFASDRIKHPEFFCWSAMYLVDNTITSPDLDTSMTLWSKHEPVFISTSEGEIRPTIRQGRKETDVQQTFNKFYSWNIVYDLVNQWIDEDGQFDTGYKWIAPQYASSVKREFASKAFTDSFGLGLDAFQVY